MSRPNLGGVGFLNVNAPSYADQLLRGLEIKGDLPGELSARMLPTFQLDDFREPEFWWLRRGRRFATGFQAAAVAAQFSFVELFINTSLSPGDVAAILEHLAITNHGAAVVTIALALRPLPALGVFSNTEFGHLDDRQAPFTVAAPVNQFPALNIGGGANASLATLGALSGQAWRANLAVNETKIIALPYVLTGRAVLRVVCQTVNSSIEVSASWRERELLDTEL